jgi:CubicO group peptidase (beta-lactamase class C family)
MSTLGAGTAPRTPEAWARRRAKYLSGLLRSLTKCPRVVVLALVVLVGLLLSPAAASAQSAGSLRGLPSSAEFEGFLDRLMSAEMERLDVPGAAVAVVRDGRVFFLKGYGFADRENDVAVDPSATLFRIGSVSKPLTALAALQQVERGHLDLDADVNTYLDFPVPHKNGTAVTLASLLTHTSGFEERRIGTAAREADDVEPLGEFLRENVPARFAATGEVHSYSNLNYAFVGHLVEQASGRDFADYMDDNVFAPLGMESSSFAQPLPARLESRLAVGYVGSSGSRQPGERAYDRDYPASGAVSTAVDMAKFMIAVLEGGRANRGRVVSSETAAAYLAPAYRPDPTVPGRTGGGLEELWINGEKAVGHGGDTLGSAAQMILLPGQHTGFFLAYNAAVDEFRENVMRAILDRYYPGHRSETAFVGLDRDELARFAGKYRWTRFARSKADKILAWTPPYNTTVDANADGTLTLWWLGVGEHWRYRPTGPTTFTKVSGNRAVVDGLVLDPGDRISFSVKNGHVTYLHTSLHTIALERVPVYLWGIVQLVAYVAIVALFLLSLIVWPVGALIRKRRGRPAPRGWARGALWLAVGVALSIGLATVALFLGLSDTDVVYGATPVIYTATALITIASTAGLLLIPAAAGAWWKHWFTIGGRLYYALLALTVPVLLWWAVYWNLLGFQF